MMFCGVFAVTDWRFASAAAGLEASCAVFRFSIGVFRFFAALVCWSNALPCLYMAKPLMMPDTTAEAMPKPSEMIAALRMSAACCLIEFCTCWFSTRRISRDVSRCFWATSTSRAIRR